MDYVFQALIEADPDGGFLVTFPDVPEAITAGATDAEARANAAEALGLALRGILTTRPVLPRAKARGKGLVPIAVATADAMKLALVEAFHKSSLSKSEFARRLGKGENEVRRILDPDHPTKVATMEHALAHLGKSVIVSVRDAA